MGPASCVPLPLTHLMSRNVRPQRHRPRASEELRHKSATFSQKGLGQKELREQQLVLHVPPRAPNAPNDSVPRRSSKSERPVASGAPSSSTKVLCQSLLGATQLLLGQAEERRRPNPPTRLAGALKTPARLASWPPKCCKTSFTVDSWVISPAPKPSPGNRARHLAPAPLHRSSAA